MISQINLAPKASHEDSSSDDDDLHSSELHMSRSASPTNERLRANSSASVASTGNADTRRRITKLKAREREKTRLVEYFCVVSSVPVQEGFASPTGSTAVVADVKPCPRTPGGPSQEASDDDEERPAVALDGSEFAPRVTSRYPLQDHEGNPFLAEGVTAFCFPSGKIPIFREADKSEGNRMPKVHYFVTTGERGQSMYGTCLTFWEGHEITLQMSGKKTPDDSKTGYVKKSKAERAMAAPVYNKNDFISPIKTKLVNENDDHEGITTTEVVYLPKCLVILSMHPYLVAFREYLTQLHRLSKMTPPDCTGADDTSSKTLAMTLPIERYITNFCSEIPAPPSGSFQVQTTIMDSVISIWSPPHNLPIVWVSLPFSHLFQCLDVGNVLTVWTALAVERQVLVTSTQLSLLTTCCEIFLSLLFPMKWTHAYIPVLPHFLVPILSAPMPFLCGIDKRYLAHTLEDLSNECIVVDLDKNQVSLGVKTPPLPSLPKHTYRSLYNKLDANAGCVYREVRSLRKTDDTSEMGFHLPPEVKSMADALWESRLCLFDEAFMLTFTPEERRKNWLNGDQGPTGSGSGTFSEEVRIMTLKEKQETLCWQSQWDAVQEAFLETYCFLLRSYRKYLVFPSKKGTIGDNGGGGGAYGGGFRSSEFVASQRMDMREFLGELVGSQMFDDFVTKRLYGSGSFDISFFDSAVDRYVKNQSFIATLSGSGNIRNRLLSSASSSSNPRLSDRGPPLLQSAREKRKLKTIVPPEPCGVDLPVTTANALVFKIPPKLQDEDEEGHVSHADSDNNLSPGDGFSHILSIGGDVRSITSASSEIPSYYSYPTFPDLDPRLFGSPRPMSSAVMAEYDRQREKAGKFRRVSSLVEEADINSTQNIRRSSAITGQLAPVEKLLSSAEVETFTIFFISFTAVLGKDLVSVDNDLLNKLDSKSILSTYSGSHNYKDNQSKEIANLVDEIVMLGVDSDLPHTTLSKSEKSPPRNRFNDKLSKLKIMEVRETAKAELGIAFEMLKMMKERGLRADPEAYECLIDACGRCGDTDRATQLLSRMHEDGIVADGVVYSSLVAAFSAENAWKRVSGESYEELPACFILFLEWANGASMDMDWNTLKVKKRTYIDIVKEKMGASEENRSGDTHPMGLRNTFNRIMARNNAKVEATKGISQQKYTEQYVTDQVLRQIILGENLLEIVYPDISIDTDNEFCPRCNFYLSDDDVVAGWTTGNSQEYKTQCPNCLTNFVPHFCVQSTLPSFAGSRGPSSPLLCERLSPWVLKKELRNVISSGIENLLSPEWREKEAKNAVLWWNLILSFMRYRFPFTFMLQGSFSSSLISPTPDDDLPTFP
eukprot:CCRYP_002372-RA/>CCRYP_002372-RA protein AED:0.02 eAED:0.02 QI:172/1/1/1/0.66/0.75/4/39/1339